MQSIMQLYIVILISMWLWSSTEGSMHLMLLNAIKHRARRMPTVFAIPHIIQKGHEGSHSKMVQVKIPAPAKDKYHTEETSDEVDDSYNRKRKHTRKVVSTKGATDSKVKYIYIKSRSSPKEYHVPVKYSSHKKKHYYHQKRYGHEKPHMFVKGKKLLLYEDDDHQFVRTIVSKPRPRYSHVRIIHVDDGYQKGCPYLASKRWHSNSIDNSIGHSAPSKSVGQEGKVLGSLQIVAPPGEHKQTSDLLHRTGLQASISLSPRNRGTDTNSFTSSVASSENLISIYEDEPKSPTVSNHLYFTGDIESGDNFDRQSSIQNEAILIADTMRRWPGKEAILLPGRIPGKPFIVKPGKMMIPSSAVEQLLVSKTGEPLVTLVNSIK